MADIDYNALGQAIDTTWGRSSTPKTSSYSVKLTLVGSDMMKVSYAAIVNFGTERQMIDMKKAYASESESIINSAIKDAKARYKDLSGLTLKTKETNTSDGLEITNCGVHNPKRTAYYRRQTFFEIY